MAAVLHICLPFLRYFVPFPKDIINSADNLLIDLIEKVISIIFE